MDSVQTALLMVPECGIESCVNISIKDALVVEMDAFLNVSLASIDIPGQERILNSTSVKGAINIADNGMKLHLKNVHMEVHADWKWQTAKWA